MRKLLIAILVILVQLAAIFTISPAYAYDYPLPPLNPNESWQPPYVGIGYIEPPVNVEIYSQTWSNLQISAPPAVLPGTPSSIVNAYLVNDYGHILTNLYRNNTCYLIVSLNGPGYFYLWEYYPMATTSYGHWLCYRWYRPNAGIWRIGPFAAQPSDPAGSYTWRMWFLSEYSWSTRSISFNFTPSYYPPDIPGLTPEPIYSPVINSFNADKSSIEAGETAILTWTTTNTSTVNISPGIGTVAASGSTSVQPVSTSAYTLTAQGKSGKTVSSTVTITVIPRIPPAIDIAETTIQRGQATYLFWDAPGAIQVSINGIGNVGLRGNRQVSPEKTTTYTLAASYIDGTAQYTSATLRVEQPPYLLWGIMFLLIAAAIVIAILLIRRSTRSQQLQQPAVQASRPTQSEASASTDILLDTTPLTDVASAKLIMPDGSEMLLAANTRSFGRHDFEEFIPHEHVPYISRQHINIFYENNQYYIEDHSSTNGTKLNDTNIKGTGRQALNNDDTIELAEKLRIIFKKI